MMISVTGIRVIRGFRDLLYNDLLHPVKYLSFTTNEPINSLLECSENYFWGG